MLRRKRVRRKLNFDMDMSSDEESDASMDHIAPRDDSAPARSFSSADGPAQARSISSADVPAQARSISSADGPAAIQCIDLTMEEDGTDDDSARELSDHGMPPLLPVSSIPGNFPSDPVTGLPANSYTSPGNRTTSPSFSLVEEANEPLCECFICSDKFEYAQLFKCECKEPHYFCAECLGDRLEMTNANHETCDMRADGSGFASEELRRWVEVSRDFDAVIEFTKRREAYLILRNQRLVAERKARSDAAMSPEERAVRHVRETCFNIKCPSCSAVFLDKDPNDCSCLTCSSCSSYVCAFCLLTFPNDMFLANHNAHQHVGHCPDNPGNQGDVFHPEGVVELHWDILRWEQVQLFMGTLTNNEAEAVQRELRTDLERLFEVYSNYQEKINSLYDNEAN